jgi:glycosyltransferase involved in cell wall biosynthesis
MHKEQYAREALMSVTLEVHIVSLASRAAMLDALLAELRRQVATYHLESAVAIRTLVDEGEATQGSKRNTLLDSAGGQYVVSVDDDDWVSPDYLCSLLEAIHNRPGVDVVTFHAERTIDGASPQRIVFDALQTEPPDEHSDVVLMPPNHICCWKTEIARRARHADDLPYGSDQPWWKSLLLAKAVTSQKRVPRVLYHYRFRTQNDGVPHDPARMREAMRLMGPGWLRVVWKEKSSGRLIAVPEGPVDAEKFERLGEVRLS